MIGIVFCNDLNTCPYIDKYLQIFQEKNIEYEVIIWNRAGDNREFPNNFRVYNEKSDIHVARWKKIGAFVRFRNFLNKTIKMQKYDKLVMLTTVPAIMCYNLLVHEYKNKYIFDFRDLSYERFGLYKKMVRKIVYSSNFTCISSPGFVEALGVEGCVMAHNFRYSDLEKKKDFININDDVINLLHIGITRGEAYNKRLADIFGNDKRFIVNIVGSGNDTASFRNYISKTDNVNVVGTYNNEEKRKYIDDATILLYYYPCDYNCNRALANKYYDGIIFKKPLLGNINTYSGRRLMDKGLGISLDIDDPNFADKVYEYIRNINVENYLESANSEMKNVLYEDEIYLNKIAGFLEE